VPLVVDGVKHLLFLGVHAHNRFIGPARMERIRAARCSLSVPWVLTPALELSLFLCHGF
jgi:hypothetical protein